MGALQQALKKTSGDWKAFRDAQIAEGRSQKSFWLTENEAERVRRFIHKIREKAEREAARQGEIAARKGKAGSKPKQADKPVQKSVPNPVKRKPALRPLPQSPLRLLKRRRKSRRPKILAG